MLRLESIGGKAGLCGFFSHFKNNKVSIKEKFAIEIAEQVRNGASESDVIALLWQYIDEEVDDKTRYDVDDNGEVVRHPQGDYIRYESLHS